LDNSISSFSASHLLEILVDLAFLVSSSVSDDSTVRLWDAATGAALQTLELGVTTRTLSFSTSGQYLIMDRGVLGVSSLQSSLDPLAESHSESKVFPIIGAIWKSAKFFPSRSLEGDAHTL
jgi:WD40 repeat protein